MSSQLDTLTVFTAVLTAIFTAIFATILTSTASITGVSEESDKFRGIIVDFVGER